MVNEEKNYSFVKRFSIYQKERFPIVGHGAMISAFTFCAVSYSRLCRNADGFIPLHDFFIGVFATVTLFLLVRIFDEFKDKEDDAKYRTYLPVPRGLISLRELSVVGFIVAVLQIGVIAFFQTPMLLLYLVVFAYLLLMRVEFFVPKWLKQHQMTYILSHMVIIPLVDIYSSGLDWLLGGGSPHWGLAWFFAVSYVNGVVLEFGRKLRVPEKEEDGVVSYTKMFGPKGGVYVWMSTLLVALILCTGAVLYANLSVIIIVVLVGLFILCSIPACLFLRQASEKLTKYIEYSSALWATSMYLALGGLPMLINLI